MFISLNGELKGRSRELNEYRIKNIATDFWSEDAGKYFYTDDIKNIIDVKAKRYKYEKETRIIRF